MIIANTIHDTAAENVDIKEGTTGGVLADNIFDGAAMAGDADSWVDVKGNGWLIQNNHGTTARTSGFQVNLQADGLARPDPPGSSNASSTRPYRSPASWTTSSLE